MDAGKGVPVSADQEIIVNGERLRATTAGAVFWPAQNALLLADLHFEKGSSFARKGVLLPPYDTRTTLRRIAVLCRRYAPAKIISLGDAFHDEDAEARMDEDDCALLGDLTRRHDWLWILGNHDPKPPAIFPGIAETELGLGRLIFRHEPLARSDAAGELAGHLHPCAKVATGPKGGAVMRRRCFATDGHRMILPAFGAYTGGLNILDPAFDGMFDAGGKTPLAWVLGGSGVYPFGRRSLRPDGAQKPVRRRAAPGM